MSKTEKKQNALEVVGQKLNEQVLAVMGEDKVMGFERAYALANAVQQLRELLTPEYMKPIMQLQGSALGFRTDKDRNQDGSKGPGYPESIVKECIIEAVLSGLEPVGNQFNIIAGNTYATKNGVRNQLRKIAGLQYTIVHDLPRVVEDKAAVTSTVTWTIGPIKGEKQLQIPIRVNKSMGTDAIIGKAERKARKWLFENLTGIDIPDADVNDFDGKSTLLITGDGTGKKQDPEEKRLHDLIDDCKNLEELKQYDDKVANYPDLVEYLQFRKINMGG